MLSNDHLLQAMCAAGITDRNVVYVSLPITSGWREIEFLGSVGCYDREVSRTRHDEEWVRNVLRGNEDDAIKVVDQVRRSEWTDGQIVVDPSRIAVEGWNQDDYKLFWVRLMERHVRRVVASPGWEFSRGARVEIGFALTFDEDTMMIVDIDGNKLDRTTLEDSADQARHRLSEVGWSPTATDAYLPPLKVGRPHPMASAQSMAFEWLVSEREYQTEKFGSDDDDRHLRETGLSSNGWWIRQLDRYLDQARDRLDKPDGRQSLAKFTATAVGLLEAVVRVYGEIPDRSADEPT